jgi:hypothetical protein
MIIIAKYELMIGQVAILAGKDSRHCLLIEGGHSWSENPRFSRWREAVERAEAKGENFSPFIIQNERDRIVPLKRREVSTAREAVEWDENFWGDRDVPPEYWGRRRGYDFLRRTRRRNPLAEGEVRRFFEIL